MSSSDLPQRSVLRRGERSWLLQTRRMGSQSVQLPLSPPEHVPLEGRLRNGGAPAFPAEGPSPRPQPAASLKQARRTLESSPGWGSVLLVREGRIDRGALTEWKAACCLHSTLLMRGGGWGALELLCSFPKVPREVSGSMVFWAERIGSFWRGGQSLDLQMLTSEWFAQYKLSVCRCFSLSGRHKASARFCSIALLLLRRGRSLPFPCQW